MSRVFAFIALATLVYLVRAAGLSFPERLRLAGFWEELLQFMPVAALAALVAAGFGLAYEPAWIRLCALSAAGFVALRTRQLGVSVLLGLFTVWLLQRLP